MKNRKRKPRVFLGLVNYGTQAGYLSEALRKLGYEAYSLTKIDIYNRKSDYSYKQKKGFLRKILYYKFINNLIKLKCFFKYDIFHFYFGQTLFSTRWDLYFYKIFGKRVIMEYLGNEIRPHEYLVKRYNLDPDHPFAINSIDHDKSVKNRIKLEMSLIDCRLVCLPLYIAYANFYGLPIDGLLNLGVPLPNLVPYKIPDKEIIIMHAPTSRKFKGTKHFIDAINILIERGYNIKFEILDKMSHKFLLKKIETCHIFCDQISEGWYGTVAIEAMAMGKPTCAFIDEEWLEYCPFSEELPIINTKSDNVEQVLKYYLDNLDLLCQKSIDSRIFVEKYHDIGSVAEEASKIYKKLIPH